MAEGVTTLGRSPRRWGAPAIRDIWRPVAGILVSSVVLGLVFNAFNPIGIRWSELPPKAAAFNTLAPPQPSTPALVSEPQPTSAAPTAAVSNPPPTVAVPSSTPQYVPPTPTTWAEVEPRHALGKLVLVDSRSRAAFEAAHIPGAVLLSEPPSAEDFASFRKQHATNAHLVTYCSSKSCSLSFKLAHRLAREGGYTFVQYITGGFLEWQREEALARGGQETASTLSKPLAPREIPAQERAPVTPPIAAVPNGVKLEHALPILWAQAKPLLRLGQVVLLDARSKADFDAGHVPGALWLPSDASPEAIRELLGDHPRTTRLVTYCGAMGCPEAFQLATRLVSEFDFANAQFMLEGLAEWRRAEQPAPPPDSAR